MPNQTQPTSQSNSLAVTGMVTGIVGVVLCWVPFLGFALGVLGVVFGALGLKKHQHKGFSITGLVTGGAAVVIAFIIFLFWIFVVAMAAHSNSVYYGY